MYKRAPSVRTIGTVGLQKVFGQPSWVSWVKPVTRGGGRTGRNSHANTRAVMKITAPLAAIRKRGERRDVWRECTDEINGGELSNAIELDRPESISRLSRLRSTESSTLLW